MKVALILVTDGREYIHDTVQSLKENRNGVLFDQVVIVNDKNDQDFADQLVEYAESLTKTNGTFVVDTAHTNRGFTKQIILAWSLLNEDIDYVFHLEDDFVFLEELQIHAMIRVLEKHPYLVQMALLRGPVNEDERKAGGIVEQAPADYLLIDEGDVWREHRKFFTTNPSVYKRSLTLRGWPDVPNSEGIFGWELLQGNPDLRSAFWTDHVTVEHIGHVRSGTGY